MIEFTIKTLDSCNHQFSVDDEITVAQLKEQVKDQIGIQPNLQRLIFCGRVLQDDKKLSEYDVNGKVMHLVQRPPPSPGSRRTANAASGSSSPRTPDAHPNFRRFIGPSNFLPDFPDQLMMMRAAATGRLDLIRRMITDIKKDITTLKALRHNLESSRDTASGSSEPQQDFLSNNFNFINEGEETIEEENPPEARRQASSMPQRPSRRRQQMARPRELGVMLDELEGLQQEFAPFKSNYVQLLRDSSTNPEYGTEERNMLQRQADIVSDVLHSFAHAYHAISDVTFTVGQRNPRLLCDDSLIRDSIPVQAHINVVQTNRRPQPTASAESDQTATGNPTASQTFMMSTPTQETPTASPQTARPTQPQNTTQPTVNVNIQPNPITYQVEFDTSVPIAFGLNQAMINNQTANSTANVEYTNNANHPLNPFNLMNRGNTDNNATNVTAGADNVTNTTGGGTNSANDAAFTGAATAPDQDHTAPNPNQLGPTAAPPGDRRPVWYDLEDQLLRVVGGTGGVEIVMRMEEVPQGALGAIGLGGLLSQGPPAAPTTPGNNISNQDTNAMPPLPENLLQNIVESVIRQGLMPSVEIIQNVQNLARSQVLGQNAQPNAQNRPSSIPGVVYDRFLHCHNQHAERRLHRRRELHQHEVTRREQTRSERPAHTPPRTSRIENLSESITSLTPAQMQLVVQLLNSPADSVSWLTAVLVTIADQLFLNEGAQNTELMGAPNDFIRLRRLLRSCLQILMEQSIFDEFDPSANAFVTAADYIVTQNRDFINRIGNITPVRSDVDLFRSLRSLLRARLPAVIAVTMSDFGSESYVTRFYTVITRLFTDACTIMAYTCEQGVEGLRAVYTAFMNELMTDFRGPVRQTLTTLGTANLEAILNSVTQSSNIQQFIVRPDEETADAAESDNTMAVIGDAQGTATSQDRPISPNMASVLGFANLLDTSTLNNQTMGRNLESAIPASLQFNPLVNLANAAASLTNASIPRESHIGRGNATVVSSQSSHSFVPNSPPAAPSNIRYWMESIGSSAPQPTAPPRDQLPGTPDMLSMLNNFDNQWVPVLEQDRRAQCTARSQQPFSNAYLSGMPSKKRRRLCHSRQTASTDAILDESVREVVENNAALPDVDQSLRASLRDHFRTLTRARAGTDDDFEAERYPATVRFIAQDNNRKRRTSDSGGNDPSS